MFLLTLAGAAACKQKPADDSQAAPAKPERAKKMADEPTSALGSTCGPELRAALSEVAATADEDPPLDLPAFAKRYRAEGSPLALWVQEADRQLGRVDQGAPIDHRAMLELLDRVGAPETNEAVLRSQIARTLERVALLDMRRRFDQVAPNAGVQGLPREDLHALRREWDAAWCSWDAALRPHASAADHATSEGWERQITESFEQGRRGLDHAYRETELRPARQVAEKGTYAVVHRTLLERARVARESADALAAADALGLLGLIEDRIADRNGPGLARIQAMLAGPTDAIDPAAIERELAKAFVKRARKYCDEAVTTQQLGTGEGLKGAWEGWVYSRVILPGMRETLGDQGFDPDAYQADWEAYAVAVHQGDSAAAAALSERLVQWNCAYQDALGIAECTASADEPS